MRENRSSEDYLETILLLSARQSDVHRIDVARAAGVSQPAVQKAVKLLIENGYVTTDGMHIRLTDSGKKYASEVYERHCTIRAFLAKLGVSEGNADSDACEMEHVISAETYEMMKRFIEK
ncbi:MAG TPA: metal-dependent transcriptional regulator [Candidatus Coproplasma avistercoris]|nr:metal-dependent transcriptional regulator [Candidatus Coproplasma avistercoris]